MAGLARIVLYRRERPVLIEPFGKGMLLTTLRYDNTVRQAETVFDDIKKREDRRGDDRARQPHHRQEEGQVRSLELRGPLREGAARPDQGEEGRPQGAGQAKPAPKPSNVINLFDALKKSLDGDGGDRSAEARRQRKAGRSAKPPARKEAARQGRRPREAQIGIRRMRHGHARDLPRQAQFQADLRAVRRAGTADRRRRQAASSSFTSTTRRACTTISGSSMTACCGAGR